MKKQTALRLAHEQQGQPADLPSLGSHDRILPGDALKSNGQDSSFHGNHVGSSMGSTQGVVVAKTKSSNVSFASSGSKSRSSKTNPVYVFDQNSTNCYSGEQPSKPTKQLSTTKSASDSSRPSTRSSKPFSSNAEAKRKLPHGLTVHELKEMTKARLQAEAAAERRDVSSPERFSPVPTLVRASHDNREMHLPVMVPSPPPQIPHPNYVRTVLSPFSEPKKLQPPGDSWSHDSRNEGWENGSVSTQTSEYYGSEQAFGGAASFNGEEFGFNRARSFSANSVTGQTRDLVSTRDVASPAMGQSQSPYYDQNFAPNRRRAATLSPRLGLSYVHEDRPVFHVDEIQGVPSFHSSRLLNATLPNRTALDPFIDHSDSFYGTQDSSLNLRSFDGNRIRTSSAVSLPAISHTGEEFAHDDTANLSGFVGTSSHLMNSSAVTGLSDVFHDSANHGVPAPPGFLVDQASLLPSAERFSEPRARASTWASSKDGLGLFGSGLLERGHDDILVEDLASILKLSGAEERDNLQMSFP